MEERIVITGMGAVSPIGLSVAESWKNACEGVSGVGPITLFDASDLQVQIACEVKNFVPENYLPAREARRRDRYQLLAAAAVKEAVAQSGIQQDGIDPTRVGVILSSAIGGFKSIQETVLTLHEQGPRKISPFAIPMLMSNGAAGNVSIDYGFCGPSFSVASACASGADGIGTAWMMLRTGMIDAAVTGGCETTLTDVGVATFDRLGAMSRRNEPDGNGRNPYRTPSPFSRDRDGLVMGEGAAVLILERESSARRRGAVILAELAGYGASADAYHITAPQEDGQGSARAMLQAMEAARVNQDEIGYINAHGTATQLNDLAETRAIKSAFGNIAYNIPVSSTKSMTGHMMGATGALEAVFCAQAVRDGVLPPTINYHEPDPDCDLDYVPNEARTAKIKIAVSNAFGFGGHNAVLVIKGYD
jgi:3-oxoacyl-[acyl-carrier-protein] synthase II